ncbi:hypothetical protein [Tomitella gaofuii]|uniref:hypothetical protein n=1 Tax=Tomitella gaofuii TaxID=2760083 RepID=UPI0015FAC45C|nr:hypothetical protein [Tomitella gaofuii]
MDIPVRTTALTAQDELSPAWWVLAAHGGSGATALARMWGPAADAAGAWPAGIDEAVESPYVVLVARESAAGLAAAHDVLSAYYDAQLDAELIGLVTVAAAPRLPTEIRGYLDVVGQAAPAHWRIGWHRHWLVMDTDDLPTWQIGDTAVATRREQPHQVPADMATTGNAVAEAIHHHLTDLYGPQPPHAGDVVPLSA